MAKWGDWEGKARERIADENRREIGRKHRARIAAERSEGLSPEDKAWSETEEMVQEGRLKRYEKWVKQYVKAPSIPVAHRINWEQKDIVKEAEKYGRELAVRLGKKNRKPPKGVKYA